jgi:hypothetical protein
LVSRMPVLQEVPILYSADLSGDPDAGDIYPPFVLGTAAGELLTRRCPLLTIRHPLELRAHRPLIRATSSRTAMPPSPSNGGRVPSRTRSSHTASDQYHLIHSLGEHIPLGRPHRVVLDVG